MNVGIISDTHGYLDSQIATYFSSCEEIWHAGDIGTIAVLDALDEIAPVKAVYGNVDSQQIRLRCPEDLVIRAGELKIFLTHIAGKPGKYNPRVRSILNRERPDIIICGHSHILKITKDPVFDNLLYINPGAAGRHGFHHQKTVVRMSIDNGVITNLEVIELGKRGSF